MKKVKLIGSPDLPEMYVIRDFLKRSVIDFEILPKEEGTTPEMIVIEFEDGARLLNPTLQEIAGYLGWITKPSYDDYDLAIFGAGPAGLSAAVYAASEGLKTVLVERAAVGGQAGTSSMIENYLGFPEGVSGMELAERARQQALKFGAEILLLREGITVSFIDNRISVKLKDNSIMRSKTNICATGVEYARLNLAEELRFLHKGLYYGASTSEAMLCSGKDIFVVGGGNMAGQAALHFSSFARTVYMVIRKGSLSATLSDYLIKRIMASPNIKVLFQAEVTALDGDSELRKIQITDNRTGKSKWHDTSKLFVCIGGDPNTNWAKESNVLRCDKGYLITGNDLIGHRSYQAHWCQERLPYNLETSSAGLFAIGDVRFGSIKRVASAVGEGAMAVSQVHRYLAHHGY